MTPLLVALGSTLLLGAVLDWACRWMTRPEPDDELEPEFLLEDAAMDDDTHVALWEQELLGRRPFLHRVNPQAWEGQS